MQPIYSRWDITVGFKSFGKIFADFFLHLKDYTVPPKTITHTRTRNVDRYFCKFREISPIKAELYVSFLRSHNQLTGRLWGWGWCQT